MLPLKQEWHTLCIKRKEQIEVSLLADFGW